MLILATTTDKIQLVTGQAVTVDVHASHVDFAAGVFSPDKTNTAITTAATTDIVAPPAASAQRNVKTVNVRNKHASLSVDVTAQYNQNGTIFELFKVTLAPGDTLEYVEGVGWFKVPNPVNAPGPNISTSDQAIGASVTNYITNSDLRMVAGRPLRAGTVIRWHITFTKTAAGTTADTSRASLATGTQTGVADNGELEVGCTIEAIGASGILKTTMQMEHNFAATGLAPTNTVTSYNRATAVDLTNANLIFGFSLTTGALHAITITRVVAEIVSGTI